MKKHRFEIIIFTVEAVCMILELVASRVLSPYFGSSNVVWTSVIAIILLSSSIGNYLGGKIADKEGREKNLKIILILAATVILIIPQIEQNILNTIVKIISNIKIGAIISTIALFLIPSIILGLIPPIILKLKLKDIENAGKVSGKINAIATIGGILGTILGGFFLVPNIGSVYILFILSIILLLIVPVVDFKIKNKLTIILVALIINSIISMNLYMINNKKQGNIVLENQENMDYVSYDTEYGRVWVYNRVLNEKNIRVMNIDSGYESATYTDENQVNELVFEYTKYYDLMFKSEKEIQNVMLIGGAGYSYPKYFISHFENKNIDVVEIDGKITEIAKKYFYLQKLIDDYDLENNKRLNLINEDGRVYLNNSNKKYDAILNDAFSGNSPAKTLTTLEAAQNIKKSLNDNGLYLTNVISSLEGEKSQFIKAEVNTLKQVFKHVYVIPCGENYDAQNAMNNMVIATDDDNVHFENTYELKLDKNEIILTDDYNPVDTLVMNLR
ncbi:MAG: fused MFS/spermidine synthase [Clostridia bacterium]|nr:fused MFS/spermidine synthase [Clostridia bacterium]